MLNTDNLKFYSNFCPMIAHIANETDEQFEKRWSHFDILPEIKKEKLSNKKTTETIQQIQTRFILDIDQVNCISRAIRSYYFDELKLDDMPFVLAKEMNVDLTKAKEISQMIIGKIINDDSYEKASQDKLEKLTIPEAMKNYPEVGEQLITSDRIKIRNFPEPARPSLKNWLADYVITVGREGRNAVKRGTYLFQSENGKNLSASDRQHLSYFLRSLDENSPVTVDKIAKKILLSQLPENPFPSVSKVSEPEFKNNIGTVQFSYPQKPQANSVVLPKAKPEPESKNNFGANVVNLKE